MLASLVPPFFLDTYTLSTSSLGCNALWLVISFLLLCSNCLSSSLVHLKKESRITFERYSPSIYSFDEVSSREFCLEYFLVLLKYSFWILSFICTFFMVSASKMTKHLYVSFSPSVLILSWFGSSIPSIRCHLTLFITSMAHYSTPNSIPMFWLYILTSSIRVSNSCSSFANSLMSSMYIRWMIFSCDSLSLYLAEHFLMVHFLNQNLCMAWCFQVWYFLVSFWVNRCVFSFFLRCCFLFLPIYSCVFPMFYHFGEFSLIFPFFRIFQSSINRWPFTGAWETTRLLFYPRVFWLY